VLQSQDLIYIADVWVNEPSPSLKMIETSYIATPHIAGYSIEGRLNGAKIIAKECAKIFKCLKPSETKTLQPSAWPYDLNNIVRDIHNVSFPISLFNSELDLKSISDSFKKLSIANLESGFRFQRESHSPRNDFNSFSFKGISVLDQELDLGFFNELGGA
jgi:erythronate-4-phosphate dehydrogenase